MTAEIELPIDSVIASVSEQAAASEDGAAIALENLNELWAEDSRRTLFGMLRQARAISQQLAEDQQWLAFQRREVERKNESKVRSLAFLEAQIQRLGEQMLAKGSKHVDVPGAGRIQYRDYQPAIHITDADAFIAALGPDERELMVEMRPNLDTKAAKAYAAAVLETDGGELLPGVERVPERRTATIEYEAISA